jgi:heme exporter protein C
MAMTMVAGILVMTAAAWSYTIAISLARVQAIIVERERGASWLESLIAAPQ